MKYNKGFAPIAIIAIIIGALVVVGGAYYVGKSSKTVPQNTVENNYYPPVSQNGVTNTPVINSNIPAKNTETEAITENQIPKKLDCKIYKNTKSGYETCYPSNWFFSQAVNSSGDIVDIQNMKVIDTNEGGFEFKDNGSQIQIEVTFNMNYKDIAEFTKDPQWMLAQTAIDGRLARDTVMNIGGQNLLVESYVGSTGQYYNFVYSGKLYKISCGSGSNTQYNIDLKVFNNLISSFKLN